MTPHEHMVEFIAEADAYADLADEALRQAARKTSWWNRGLVAGQIAQANATLAVLAELRALRTVLVPPPEVARPPRPEAYNSNP
jgi:hypothetical protein